MAACRAPVRSPSFNAINAEPESATTRDPNILFKRNSQAIFYNFKP